MTGQITFHDLHPPLANMRKEVLDGLSQPQKTIPPKFFYDQNGSKLFDAITQLPEYYLTRTEIEILELHGKAMARYLGRDTMLIELGSGSSHKVRLLLDALSPAVYVPVDISREHLLKSAQAFANSYPNLIIHAICADYSEPFEIPDSFEGLTRVAFFPGSSIGNFDPSEASAFLRRTANLLGPDGRLLIGVDLRKDPEILNAAYNDAQRVTADFNLNLLRRINNELNADFQLEDFEHRAFFNDQQSRVEMHLVSLRAQTVSIAEQRFHFSAGETLHTENSHKYSLDGFQTLAQAAGFKPEQVWTDAHKLFSVHGLVVLD